MKRTEINRISADRLEQFGGRMPFNSLERSSTPKAAKNRGRPTTKGARDARAAARQSQMNTALAAAASRGWVGCGDLVGKDLRRSPIFKLLPDSQRFAFGYVVNAANGCWDWVATKGGPDGYGQISHGRRKRNAHRVSYEMLVGPVPSGLTLDHLCMNKGCVNPKHLEPVTSGENTRRWAATITHCPHGHEMTPENTRIVKGTKRECWACRREHWVECTDQRRMKAILSSRTTRKKTSPGVSALRIIARRSDGLCELPECGVAAVHTHHRRPRGMGGSSDYLTNLPANLLRVCLACHERIESNRSNAYAFGLLVHQGVDPATVPALTRHHSQLVLLTNDGGVVVIKAIRVEEIDECHPF